MNDPAQPYDTIVCIGAGRGEGAAEWIATGARHIVLVEPNPACIPALHELAAQDHRIEVIEAAIADQDGEAQLRVLNLARHSSLHRPTGLIDLLPGVRQVALLPVRTMSPATLLEVLSPLQGDAALVIDAPGSEMHILQGFIAAGALSQFALKLTCADEPLYEDAVGRATLQALVEDAGFALTDEDLSDPDWPQLSFRTDRKARLITELTAQLEASRAEIGQLNARITADAAQLVELQGALSKHATGQQRLDAELVANANAVKQQALALTRAEGREKAALNEISCLRAILTDAQAERQAAARQIADLGAQLAEVQRAVPDDSAALAAKAQDLDDARAVIAAREGTISRLEADLAEAHAALAARMDDLQAATARLDRQDSDVAALQKRVTELEGQLIVVENAGAGNHANGAGYLVETTTLQAARIKDMEFRQSLARDELRRYEGQIDMIKDLLLRGDRL